MKVLWVLALFVASASAISSCHDPIPGTLTINEDDDEPFVFDQTCAEKKEEMESRDLLLGEELPRCNDEGHYDLYQCSGSECYCTNCAGEKIEEYKFNRNQQDENRCLCAREMEKFQRTGMVGLSFRCELEGGHYKSYKCVGTGCFCVHENGEMIITDDEEAQFTPWTAHGKDDYCDGLRGASTEDVASEVDTEEIATEDVEEPVEEDEAPEEVAEEEESPEIEGVEPA